MSAVARLRGAPSGSVYHRFSTRAALCGQLWLRTQARFHAGLMAALEEGSDTQDACVSGALFTVRWCRDFPIEAQVLLAGADALGRADWPDELAARHDDALRAVKSRLRTLARRRGEIDRVFAALVDIPYAVVRRPLLTKSRIPASAEGIVADCARALVSAD
jgi:AcrR family transcriptional regulator